MVGLVAVAVGGGGGVVLLLFILLHMVSIVPVPQTPLCLVASISIRKNVIIKCLWVGTASVSACTICFYLNVRNCCCCIWVYVNAAQYTHKLKFTLKKGVVRQNNCTSKRMAVEIFEFSSVLRKGGGFGFE